MDKFAALTGRATSLFDYVGAPDAERVIVLMGSGAESGARNGRATSTRQGEKVGVLKVRLFRPFSVEALPRRPAADGDAIAVLDRTKEPGAIGEPLYLDVVTALAEACSRTAAASHAAVIGGRYGLSSKEFTPRW